MNTESTTPIILLDFFSGSHGHFLEYVINTWLFNGPRVPNLFTDLGTSHGIRTHHQYQQSKIVCSGHYTEFKIHKVSPHKLIRISINSDWANYIYQINVMARAGDIPIEKKILLINQVVRDIPRLYRNEWFSKFNFTENGYRLPEHWYWPDVVAFDFPMESLFDVVNFYQELYRLAEYLQQSFKPDRELGTVFENFLIKNQGWQYWHKAKLIVDQTLLGKTMSFDSDQILEALINTLMSQCVGMFEGVLFDHDQYPRNTKQLQTAVEKHVLTFDKKF